MTAPRPADSRYAPGGGWCLATSHAWVLAGDSASPGGMLQIAAATRDDWSPRRLLAAVPDQELPGGADWAIALIDGTSLRLLLRGAVVAVVSRAEGHQELSGSTLGSWSEHTLPSDWGQVALRLAGTPADPGVLLPLSDGIAQGSGWLLLPTWSARPLVPFTDALAAAPVTEGPESTGHHTLDWSREQHQKPAVAEPMPAAESDKGSTAHLVALPTPAAPPERPDDEMHHLIFGRTENRAVSDAAGLVVAEAGLEDVLPVSPSSPALAPSERIVPQTSHQAQPVVPLPAADPVVGAQPSGTSGLINSFWGAENSAVLSTVQPGPPAPAPPALPSPASAAHVSGSVSEAQVGLDFPDEDLGVTIARPQRVPLPAVDSLSVQVLSAQCQSGHLNPPTGSTCRVCGAAIPEQQPVRRVRPPLGNLRLSTEQVVVLDRDVLLGRKPSVPKASAPRPHVVQIGSDAPDVSRTHLQIRLEEWEVLATDLSSNGTLLELPGREPEQLRAKQPHPLLSGSKLWLGDTVWALYEATP